MITLADIVAMLIMLMTFLISWWGATRAITSMDKVIGPMGTTVVSYAAMIAGYLMGVKLLLMAEVLW